MTLLLTLFWPDGRLGSGIARERRPGVFEIRIAVGVDPVSGRTVQRSFWFHGALEDAEERRSELATQLAEYPAVRRAAAVPHRPASCWSGGWPPTTTGGLPLGGSARSNVKALTTDPLAERRVSSLRPEVVREAMARWKEMGASVSVVSGRFRVLRSSVGWAQSESIIDRNPIRDMRGAAPPRYSHARAGGGRSHTDRGIGDLGGEGRGGTQRLDELVGHALHKAEQVQLLVRLAADSGARRGEWLHLRFGGPGWQSAHHRSGGSRGRGRPPRPGRCAG